MGQWGTVGSGGESDTGGWIHHKERPLRLGDRR